MSEKKYSGYGYHGGGRPKSDKTKKKNLNIRVSEEELDIIKKKAADSGLSVTEYIIKKCAQIPSQTHED